MCSLYHPDPVGQHRRLSGFYSRTRIIRIGGDTNEVVAPGEEGELIVDAAGDAVFTEYLNRPEATAEKLGMAGITPATFAFYMTTETSTSLGVPMM